MHSKMGVTIVGTLNQLCPCVQCVWYRWICK